MALYSKTGAVALNLAAGSQVVSGLGFQPKIVLFTSTPSTANVVTSIANYHASIGAFDGVNNVVQAGNSRNGIITSQTNGYANITDSIYVADPPGTSTPDYIARGTSLNADGFTMNVIDPPPINYRFGYWALGGNDILNVKAGNFLSPGFAGVQATTGIGFQPNLLIVFASFTNGAFPASVGDGYTSMGFANGLLAANQYAGGTVYKNATSPITVGKDQNAGFIVWCATTGVAVGLKAILSSFDADGFTLNWTAHSPVSALNLSYIAIQGGASFKSKIGTFQMANSTGTTKIITGLGFTPTTALFASPFGLLNSANSTGNFSVGVVDSAKSHFVIGGSTRTNAGSINAWHTQHDQRMIRSINYFDSTIFEDGSLQTWDADGFTILSNKGAFPSTSSFVGYLALAGTSPPPPPATTGDFGFMV